jgi:bifunctional non-homologous end joining protein LigD
VFNEVMRGHVEPCFIAFDLPWLDGEDLRELPLLERKRRLREIIPKRSGSALYLEHVEGNGTGLFELVCRHDLEGIVAKPKRSPYRATTGPCG